MNIAKEMVSKFERFLDSQRGVRLEKSVFEGESLRGMLGESLLIVREHALRRSADTVEVFCSDKEALKEVEADFVNWLIDTGEVTLEEPKGKEGTT